MVQAWVHMARARGRNGGTGARVRSSARPGFRNLGPRRGLHATDEGPDPGGYISAPLDQPHDRGAADDAGRAGVGLPA